MRPASRRPAASTTAPVTERSSACSSSERRRWSRRSRWSTWPEKVGPLAGSTSTWTSTSVGRTIGGEPMRPQGRLRGGALPLRALLLPRHALLPIGRAMIAAARPGECLLCHGRAPPAAARIPRCPGRCSSPAALAVRALRFGLVFTAGGVRFPHGADELYHLRRIWFSVVNFPASLYFDPYLNHPLGAPAVWPPLFDWSIAAVARALVGPADQGAVEVVAAWVPPVLGAVTVLVAAWLARRAFSPAAGWVTGALLAVQPAHVFYSQLGEVDHHVAVGLFVLLLIGAAMRLAGPVARPGRPRAAIATGVAAAAAILLWPGSLLHVGVVQAFLWLQLLATREQAIARLRARALAALHAAADGRAAAVLRGPELGAVRRGLTARALELPAALVRRGTRRARARGVAVVAAGPRRRSLAAHRLRARARGARPRRCLARACRASRRRSSNAASWFEADPFLGVISEMQPLLFAKGRFDADACPRPVLLSLLGLSARCGLARPRRPFANDAARWGCCSPGRRRPARWRCSSIASPMRRVRPSRSCSDLRWPRVSGPRAGVSRTGAAR